MVQQIGVYAHSYLWFLTELVSVIKKYSIVTELPSSPSLCTAKSKLGRHVAFVVKL